MAPTQAATEVVLYDLANIKNECFSPVVWRIRMMLNYKNIPYKTVFLEFPDIEPKLKELGIDPGVDKSGVQKKYTVPVIHYLPTGEYIIDSTPISQFLESTYAEPSVPLQSDLGTKIEAQGRAVIGTLLGTAMTPREPNVLSPRAAEFFRRTREAAFGVKHLDELLEGDKEERAWATASGGMKAVGEMLKINQKDGPFVLGAKPSYTDFFVAGSLQAARVVDEGVFQKIVAVPGFGEVYEACQPFMVKRD
ncbi:hypothetical protein LTR56_020372 [Elasticomyces elasticus]|nr:hypothetical protein LTR56_020372 [Elasticomyces elasticus]KAK3633096.1 hypothetical protein LTR22_020294 [Elasticomyces elasticus]KAK4910231.1 hypothetical protein LTR49_021048 [Elasticomyces elasticus]KAK5749983.1 hypothetical protein LTS12_019931 [Elasticomyces elasticus]